MHQIYQLAVGPLAWLTGVVFIVGCAYRLWSMYQSAKNRDPLALEYMNLKYGLRSILHWSVPFWPVNSRKHPVLTVVTFVFHICLIILPIFLTAHVLLWDYFHDFYYWSLPETVGDVMTVLVIISVVFFGVRRTVRPEVRYVTTYKDRLILAVVGLPFLTGFLAYHHIGPYTAMLTLHILSGEAMLIAIPFTRLSHMLFAPFTRAYVGSEFGAIRRAIDW